MDACPRCGRPREEGAAFCPYCGSELPSMDRPDPARQPTLPLITLAEGPFRVPDDRPVPPAGRPGPDGAFAFATASRRRWRLWSRLLVAFGVVVALALVTGATAVHLQTRSRLHRTQAQLADTRSSLAETTSRLESTQAMLESTQQDLQHVQDERDRLRTQLQGVRGSLQAAQGRLELQAGQIDTLKACLSGVAIALDDVLNFDYSGAASALSSVQIPCEKAFALL